MKTLCLPRLLCLWTALALAFGLPTLAQNAAPSRSASGQDVDGATLEEITITGVRGSLMRSVEAKRHAATIIDAISAEELGKFPSRNVADALINIPGVTVERTSGGEGQRITIRGLGGDFNITTLNGRILAVEDSGREFSFDVLPSEMIAGADVYKAVRAQNLEGTLGGAVDLLTARPFDYKGLHLAGSVEGEYGDLPGKWGKKISGVVSNTFDDGRMGALLTVSYSKRATRTDNLHEISSTSGTEQDWNVDFNRSGIVGDTDQAFIFPQFYSVGTILGDHKRLGVSGSFQFKPNDRVLLTLDGMYSHYDASTQNYASSNHVTPREDQEAATLADPTALKWLPGSIQADANGVVTNFSMTNLVAEVLDDTNARAINTRLFGANLKWDLTDRLQVAGDAYLSEAARNSGGLDRFVVAGIIDATGVFATRNNGLPDLNITIPGGRTLEQATNADYRPHYIGIYGDNLKDRINSGKLDGKLVLDWQNAKALRFGVNFTDRRKSSLQIDNNDTACQFCGYPFTFADIGASVVEPLPVSGLLRDLPGNFPRNFATFDIDTYLNSLLRAEQNPSLVIYCPPANSPCPPGQLTQYPAGYSRQVLAPDLPASFDVDEKTTAAYFQLELAGKRWRGDAGLRLVHTKVLSTGYSKLPVSVTKLPASADYTVVFTDPEAVRGGGSYTKALPAVNFAYDIRPDLTLRLAASKVLSRPSLVELTPASDWSNWESGSFVTYFLGNPDLKPTDSTQWDASLEWYLSSRSYVSMALFYKDLKNFVTGATVEKVFHDPSGQDYTYTENDIVNGDSGTIRGAELAGQYLFDNGFGVVANLTTTSSTSVFGGVNGRLPGVIPHSYNLKLLYEKHGWSNQLSYSYTSKFTHDLDSPYIAGLPIISDEYKDLSATFSYEFGKHLTAYLEGSNLLNNADFRFSTYRNVPAYYEAWGRAYFVGLRARL
jgi:TonB-dependent receptor